ncbi:hypothetical protein [Bacillus wiedmannii]|uniref:hypothetical protein n=1 Tax=Bacillus wiedmannii TaxID=1890302 RepID=UPI000D035D56|nr:hypothetical protein [Bacillus wiedmannii]PRT26189.1 hypothetical protein C6358_30115 [Bacillus wiedmannii]PRT37700.1 hypothetical protein C6359_30230 [Bacillus wiedmannii]
MASINGIEIKTYTIKRGHDGEPLQQAVVYIDGKKAGYVSDGDWGGPMVLEFSNYDLTVIKQRLFAYAKHENFISSISRGIEMLFALLLGYVNLEKVYKKISKKNKDLILLVVGLRENYLKDWSMKNELVYWQLENNDQKKLNTFINEIKKSEGCSEVIMFQKQEDFHINTHDFIRI